MGRDIILVGVDGGGTRCRARARRPDGTIVGECITGTANLLAGIEITRDSVVAAVTGALRAGGYTAPHDIAGAVVGMGLAGANIPELASAFLASGLPFAHVALEMDGWVACRGAHPSGDGAIAILGTGTAYVAHVGGRFVTIGGWGFHVGDQGSGAWLGRAALARALLAFDRIIAPTPFSEAVLARFDGKPDRIVTFSKNGLARDYGEFAPLVFEHADRGDPIAGAIVTEAVREIDAALARLAGLGAGRISLIGGLAPIYEPRLATPKGAAIVPPASDPLDGALALAATLIGKGTPA